MHPHLGKNRGGRGSSLPLQKQIPGQQLDLMGKGAGTHMQGLALPQSCGAVVGTLPHTPAFQYWELVQICPVAPQQIKASSGS